jgi:hypothetical protein
MWIEWIEWVVDRKSRIQASIPRKRRLPTAQGT